MNHLPARPMDPRAFIMSLPAGVKPLRTGGERRPGTCLISSNKSLRGGTLGRQPCRRDAAGFLLRAIGGGAGLAGKPLFLVG